MRCATKEKPIPIIIRSNQKCVNDLNGKMVIAKNITRKSVESHIELIPNYKKETISKKVYFGNKKPLITNSTITNKK